MASEVWMPGDLRMEVRLTGADTGGAFCLLVDQSPPGWGLPPHRHANESETIFVMEGLFEVDVDGVTHRLGPGELVHVPTGVEHSGRNIGDDTGRRLLVFSPAGIEDFFLAAGSPTRGTEPDFARIGELAEQHGYRFSGEGW